LSHGDSFMSNPEQKYHGEGKQYHYYHSEAEDKWHWQCSEMDRGRHLECLPLLRGRRANNSTLLKHVKK